MNLGVLTWTSHIFEELEEEGHTIPHWKALRYGKGDSRWQSCGSTLNIYKDVLKSGNLQGFVDSQFGALYFIIFDTSHQSIRY